MPLLQKRSPHLIDRIAAGLVAGGFDSGCGSEIGGFDDEISRDHNWGPRFFLFMSETDKREWGNEVETWLNNQLPSDFAGFGSTATTLPKGRVYITTPEEHCRAVLKMDTPPQSDVAWITIPEVLLFEYTAGPIFYDPQSLVASIRDQFLYYPDNVWYKRLSFSFFMLHLAGNIHRSAMRKDIIATQTYVNWFLQIAIRTCFLLKRTYAPYCKWLFKAFKRLPGISDEFRETIETIATHIDFSTIDAQCHTILDYIGTMANESGLIEPLPLRKESPFIWTDFNCYGFMYAFHNKITGALKESDPFEQGPYDLLATNSKLNREIMITAWETLKR